LRSNGDAQLFRFSVVARYLISCAHSRKRTCKCGRAPTRQDHRSFCTGCGTVYLKRRRCRSVNSRLSSSSQDPPFSHLLPRDLDVDFSHGLFDKFAITDINCDDDCTIMMVCVRGGADCASHRARTTRITPRTDHPQAVDIDDRWRQNMALL
jgi:hypothetical protein